MLSKQQALYYSEQLHPAFAGYIHDGEVTQRDALATIINLQKKGSLGPIWKKGNMLDGIERLRLMRKKPQSAFEQLILSELFKDKKELTAKEIGDYVKSGTIQTFIKQNLQAISAFPIINNELKFTLGKHGQVNFSVNGNPVDTIEEATKFKKILKYVLLPIFVGVGIFMIIFYFIFKNLNPTSGNHVFNSPNVSMKISGDFTGDPSTFLLTAGIMIGVMLLIAASFYFSKKTVTYSFENNILPLAKTKYSELYEFLSKYPLQSHRFTNEFLAFSIAFGLDNSWFKDYHLEEEVRIDESPMIK